MIKSNFTIFAWLLLSLSIIQSEAHANLIGNTLYSRPDSFARMYLAINPFDESFARCKVAIGLSNGSRDASCKKTLRLLNAFSDLVGMGVIRDDDKETLNRVLDHMIRYKERHK